MERLLSENQIGFLKGRNILQGFYYTQELVREATKQKKQIALLKADIHKAFDSIEWEFLLKCLQAIGFSQTWIDWIRYLVLLGRSKVVLNSVAGREIILQRSV
jgi:Reverse transcriptase (RNA-dependent DNA polymerase)